MSENTSCGKATDPMKKVEFVVFLVLVCISSILPLVRSDQSRTYTLSSNAWNVDYTISKVLVKPGDVLTLYVNFTTNVPIYDWRIEVTSNPATLVANNIWGFDQIDRGLPQLHTFEVQIPNDAPVGTKYQIDLFLQGYKDPPFVSIFGWRPHAFLWWVENPEYTGNTTAVPGDSIVLTVI